MTIGELTKRYLNDNNVSLRTMADEMTAALQSYPYPEFRAVSYSNLFFWKEERTKPSNPGQFEHIAEHAESERLREYAASVLEVMRADPDAGNDQAPLVDPGSSEQ